MDYQAPPFFKRGPAPLALLCFYTALSLALIIFDARFQTLELLRSGLSLLMYPFQRLAFAPASLYEDAHAHFSSLNRVQADNTRLKRVQLENAARLLRVQQLEVENERLRKLLDMRTLKKADGQVARILYSARDPFSRKLVVDKGGIDGISRGQAVVDYNGVIGQVTRVFPHVSEVTLITDKNHAIPVQILRNGLRSVLFGIGNGQLELRFTQVNADIQSDDQLVTSGLGGAFPAGLPVARVVSVEHDAAHAFARVYCLPLAGIENFSELMILDPIDPTPLPQELVAAKTSPGRKKRTARQ
ncbi:MAG: rod shape-determining protein MreC [Candidatus Accumulibacter sp.]|jgi:rod shape-determining protein MreC|nr:rod shape-determining protein MreC [Accumulibacter sp.]